MQDIIDRFNCCLTEEDSKSNAGNVFYEFSVSELEKVVAYLIEKYEERPSLLGKFWNSKSDMCPLESEIQEHQILAFEKFIQNN